MQNVSITRKGSKLFVEIDLTKEYGLSSTKKSVIIASTSGNVPVPDSPEMKLGLNLFKPAPEQAEA